MLASTCRSIVARQQRTLSAISSSSSCRSSLLPHRCAFQSLQHAATRSFSASSSSSPYRTHSCASLNTITTSAPSASAASPSVIRMSGWLQSSRDLGERWFGVLRDHTGCVQLTWSKKEASESGHLVDYEGIVKLPLESVVRVNGRLVDRPPTQAKSDQLSGAFELNITSMSILNTCATPLPFSLESGAHDAVAEELRLQYRYLDLRRPFMSHLLRLRSSIVNAARSTLLAHEFIEVETPILFKSTPEGADEFIVPTRHAGRFYALPQSPQQHKQLLMVSGVSRYFQIARCFRDEGMRADRQPEFTQLDLELAFCTQNEIVDTVEQVMKKIYETVNPAATSSSVSSSTSSSSSLSPLTFPLPHMKYADAMLHYGVDKPDTRYDLKVHDLASSPHSSSPSSLPPLRRVFHIRGLPLSRKELDSLQLSLGQQVLIVRVKDGVLKTPPAFQALFSDVEYVRQLKDKFGVNTFGNDDLLICVFSHTEKEVCERIGRARILMAQKLAQKKVIKISPQQFNMQWIVEFPLFDFTLPTASSSTTPTPPLTLNSIALTSMHHPFTAPVDADAPLLASLISELTSAARSSGSSIRDVVLTSSQLDSLRRIRGQHYDLVCNGVELGGGSIRIHDAKLQTSVLELLGAPTKVFEHLLTALRFGAPPHGGIALGVDRIVALFGAAVAERFGAATSSSSSHGMPLPIRDVIAFPKTTSGQDLLVEAPSIVPQETLRQYHIQTK